MIIRNKNRGVKTKFIVIRGHIDNLPLIGRDMLIEPGMMVVKPNGNLKETNELRIKRISEMNETKSTKELIRECDDLFQGMENIKEPKTGQTIEVGFETEAGIRPITQKPKHIPYHLDSLFKKWIEQGEADGIFEKVPRNEAIIWCSPLVIQPKHVMRERNKLEPNVILASRDMVIPNRFIKRSCRERENFVFWFGAQFNSTLDFTQSG